MNSIKAAVVVSIALFFTLTAFNNLTDFEYNRIYIAQVMSLDTLVNPSIGWRAIHQPQIQLGVYWLFILWEMATAILCWVGSYHIFRQGMKRFALIGLTLGFLQYMIGFVDLASEWFYLFQSPLKETQVKALLFSILLLGCLHFVANNNENHTQA